MFIISHQRRRIAREKNTIEAMINIYCYDLHKTQGDLCLECRELLNYAKVRLDKCLFQEKKTICANCKIHCYKPDMREKIQTVMRYAGPRMMYRHPILSMFHWIDGLRKEPIRGKSKTKK